MSYEPFGVTPPAPVGPEGRVINDFTPAKTLHRVAAQSRNVNLTAIGSHDLFTVPAGRIFFPSAIWFNPTINTAANSTPSVGVGYTDTGVFATSFEDFVIGFTFLSSLVAGQFFEFNLRADSASRRSASAGAVVKFKVETASAGPCTGDVILAGFLV